MVTFEIILVINQADIERMLNVLQQIPGVMEHRLHNQGVSIIYDAHKTQYDRILEKIIQAGFRVIWFCVTEA